MLQSFECCFCPLHFSPACCVYITTSIITTKHPHFCCAAACVYACASGHSTWDSYTAMTRIYKHFTLNLNTVAGEEAVWESII